MLAIFVRRKVISNLIGERNQALSQQQRLNRESFEFGMECYFPNFVTSINPSTQHKCIPI